MASEKKASSNKNKKKRWRWIIAILLLILALLLLHKCGNKQGDALTGVTIGVIDTGTLSPEESDLQAMVDGIVAENQFMVFINTRIEAQPDGRFAPLIQNSQSNHHACWVEIVDGDETIYESDVIQPGYKIEQDVLKDALTRGRHDCQALFHVLRGDDKSSGEINVVAVSVIFVQR